MVEFLTPPGSGGHAIELLCQCGFCVWAKWYSRIGLSIFDVLFLRGTQQRTRRKAKLPQKYVCSRLFSGWLLTGFALCARDLCANGRSIPSSAHSRSRSLQRGLAPNHPRLKDVRPKMKKSQDFKPWAKPFTAVNFFSQKTSL